MESVTSRPAAARPSAPARPRVRLVPSAAPAWAPPELTSGQQAVVDHEHGALLVLGGPGTGKTTALVSAMVERSRGAADGPRPLLLTYARRSVSIIRTQVGAALGRAGVAPMVMTFHGFAHALVRRFGSTPDLPPPRLLTAPEQEFRVREVLGGQPAGAWPAGFEAARGTRAFSAELRQVLARCRQLGLDPDDLVAMGAAAERPEWQAAGRFFEEYLDVLDAEHVLDYAELIHRSRILLTDPDVAARLRAEIGWVYVDEFHDTDPAQGALLRQLVGDGHVVVAGDPDQSVYGFRGARGRGILDVPELLGARTLVLDEGLRLPAAVHAATRRLAARLPLTRTLDAPVLAGLRTPSAVAGVRGQVQVATFDTAGAQAEHIAQALRDAHLHQGLAWADMAVLVRSGRRGIPPLARALASAGVPVDVAGDEIALAAEPAVRPLLLALDIANRGVALDADEAVRLLESPLGGLDAMAMRRLGRTLRRAERVELGDAAPGQPSSQLMRRALADPELLDDAEATPEVAQAARLSRLLHRTAERITGGASAHQALWDVWSGTPWPDRLAAEAWAGHESRRRAGRDLDAVLALFDVASRSDEVVGQRGIAGFLAEVAGQQIPADTQRESDTGGSGVRVMTAHRAKGLQWPFVVVAGVQEGQWPDLRPRSGLLEAERIEADGIAAPEPGSVRLAQERRLFYLACTRASHRLLVTAVSGTEGEGDQPSRFLGELGVPVVTHEGRGRRPLTLPALVAELRRVCVDDGEPTELRAASAARLARLADAVDDAGRPLVPSADPDRWWGMLEPTDDGASPSDPNAPLVFTGSQLGALLGCPRQWFLNRRVRADVSRGSAAGLGSVVHALAAHALTDELDADELKDGLDGVWTQLQFDAVWMSASERVEAESALERILAWQDARADREVLGVEVPFEVSAEVDGEQIVLRGTVDRLERDAHGRLRIIDFKTGRHVPTKREVSALDQLGLYQLAAQLGAFDELAPQTRTVADAELVYVRTQDGQTPYPKVLSQPSLDDQRHLPDDAVADAADAQAQHEYPTWVHHRLGKAARILREGRYPARPGAPCQWCPFQSSCPGRRPGAQVVP